MILKSLWESLEASSVGSFVASSDWAFPTLESIHVIAIVTVLGAIAVMDMRLLGWTSRDQTVRSMSDDTLPWTWGAFAIALTTGLLLFCAKATSYMVNPYFLTKMVLIAIAGINMLILHFGVWKTVHEWDADPMMVPKSARIAGALSLIFWLSVVFFGRAIGFTLGIYTAS